MSDAGAAAAQRYREHMRSKAERLGGGEDARSVDASDFTPGEKLDADAKTGMRPVSRQARASGGVVIGRCAGGRADRAPRKAGGGLGGESYVNRDAKAANQDRAGVKHDMGLKQGGRARRDLGGALLAPDRAILGAVGSALGAGGDNKPAPYSPGTGRANGGGVYLPDKEREGASETRELKRRSASQAVETRLGRASGGRVAKQGGGPLATPLAAGMGGQGRMNFNFAPDRAQMLADGGRAKARARYGPGVGPAEHHPGLARAGFAYGGRSDESLAEEHAEDPAAYRAKYKGPFGERPSSLTKEQRDAALAKSPKAFRAEGGEVAKGAVRQHHAEHKAMGLHGPDCKCERCKHKKAKGGLLKQFDADRRARAEGGTLDAADRNALSKKTFGLPGERKYPMPDKSHAANAKARASQMVAKGKLSESSKAKIDAKADRVLGRARGGKAGKGKMNVNIVIAPGGMNPQPAGPPGGGLPPNLAIRPPTPAAPMPMPGGAPPPGAAPMPMPIPVPMGAGAGMPPPGMPPRARGGRAPKMEAGAGSGLGRLEKIDEYGARSWEGAGLRK